ncbi:30S ribosomal protein S3 [uncultured bacterium]|nr:30S ribosomal protein S3 [uncultured bacterium]
MSFSYLNNANIKFNQNSYWYAKTIKEYGNFVLTEILIRDIIFKHLIYHKDFYMFDINIDLRNKQKIFELTINFKYQLSHKKLKNEEVINQINNWIKPVVKSQKIDRVVIKGSINSCEKSAQYFAQVLSREMHGKYISNKKIRLLAKTHLSRAKGYIIKIAGRINGNSIARRDKVQKGIIGRNTLRNDIEHYSFPYIGKSGCIGIKVWVNKGLLPSRDQISKDITNIENN